MNQQHQQLEQLPYSEVNRDEDYAESIRLLRTLRSDDQSVVLSMMVKCSKLLGKYLIGGLQKFMEMFSKGMGKFSRRKEEGNKKEEKEKKKEEKPVRRVGFKVDFRSYEGVSQAEQEKVERRREKKKPVRAFNFSQQEFKEPLDDDSEIKIGRKKVKREEEETVNEDLTKICMTQTKQIRKHFFDLRNKVQQDFALEMLEMRERNEKQRKKEKLKEQVEQDYVAYLKSIKHDFNSEDPPLIDPRQQLNNLKRSRKDRMERVPPRKMTQSQKETPQIYNVEKVLNHLDKQREDYLKEKTRERDEILRQQEEVRRQEEEAKRLQEEAVEEERRRQKQKIEAQQRQEDERKKQQQEQKRLEEQKQQEQQKKSDQKSNNEQGKQNSENIEQQQQENSPEEEHSFGVISKRDRKKQEEESLSVQVASPQKQDKAQISKQKSEIVYDTPPQQKQQPQPEHSIFNINPPSDTGGPITQENNPFKKASPVVPPKMDSLIKNDKKATTFGSLLANMPKNIFTSTPAMDNIFGGTKFQSNQDQPKSMFPPPNAPNPSNPSNPLNPQFGGAIPPNQGNQGFMVSTPANQNMGIGIANPSQQVGQFNSPNSMQNPGSMYQSSSVGSSYNSGTVQQPTPPMMGANPTNPAPQTSGIGMFTNNPNAAHLFEKNIFMGQQQQHRSLFDPIPPQSSQSKDQHGRGRKSRPQRIS